MELMLYGAMPFNLPEDSLAGRRARKSVTTPERMSLDRLVMLQVANEAAEAIQFILGPNHRPRPAASPSYRNPELKSYRCPPNTPNQLTSFDFAATDADCSDLSTDDAAELDQSTRKQDSSRKRRRLVSFSDSSASCRRVAHKKPTDEKSGRKIISRKKQQNNSTTSTPTTSLMTDDDTVAPRLNFFAEVQRAVGEDMDEVVEQNWKKLGKSLRAIADRFGTTSNATFPHKKQSRANLKSIDALPNGIWSAVISFVFWKIIKGYQ